MRRLRLESIGMEIIKDGFKFLAFYLIFEEDKIGANKANLVNGYILRKQIDVGFVYYEGIKLYVLNKGIEKHEWKHLDTVGIISFSRVNHKHPL